MKKDNRDCWGDPVDRSKADRAGILVKNSEPRGFEVGIQRAFNRFFLFRKLSPQAGVVRRQRNYHVFIFTKDKWRLAVVNTKETADMLVDKWRQAVTNRWLVFDVDRILRYKKRPLF